MPFSIVLLLIVMAVLWLLTGDRQAAELAKVCLVSLGVLAVFVAIGRWVRTSCRLTEVWAVLVAGLLVILGAALVRMWLGLPVHLP